MAVFAVAEQVYGNISTYRDATPDEIAAHHQQIAVATDSFNFNDPEVLLSF